MTSDARIVMFTGKAPRLPSVRARSTKIEQLQHITEEQRADIAKELEHAEQQLKLQSQYPRR